MTATHLRRTDATDKTIRQVFLRMVPDEYPDLSWLGEFTDEWSEGCVDRRDTGHYCDREVRYWKPGPNHYPHDPKKWAHTSEEDKARVIERYGSLEAADHAYMMEDYELHEQYPRVWWMLGLWAEAEIVVSGVIQTIRSGGIWGISSDSDHAENVEVLQMELMELKHLLAGLGFDEADFMQAKLNEMKHESHFLAEQTTVEEFLNPPVGSSC